jgi:YVTN family beta-propeller protein
MGVACVRMCAGVGRLRWRWRDRSAWYERQKWAREVDFHAANLESETARRLLLTSGIVPKFQLSRPYAFFTSTTAAGDFGILVDTDAASPTVHEVVARIPLAKLADGPTPGVSTAGAQARGSAITPDGQWAFVSHGGEGKVSVIDTESRAVVATIDTPTSLDGGGYLVAVQPGNTPVDTCMR